MALHALGKRVRNLPQALNGRGAAPGDPAAPMFAGIRHRLTLWYSGVLAGALLLFGVILYIGADRALLGRVDNNLAGRAQQASLLLLNRPPALFCPTGRLGARLRPQLVRGLPYWACYAPNGSVTWNSPAVVDSAPNFVSPAVFRAAVRNGNAFGTMNAAVDGDAVRWFALAVPNPSGPGILGVIQVGQDVQPLLNAAHTILMLLFVIGALVLLFAVVGGLFLANRALAPARLAFARQQAFIADAAHELRTPLTLLRADAEVLLRGRHRLSPDDAELLDDIVSEAAHMATLAGNMLTLARLDAAVLHLEREVLDLADVAAAVTRRARPLAGQMDVTLAVDLAEPALVLGNRVLLEQAALILLDNAIKYNQPGGRVTVRTLVADGQALLEVRDTGVGIAPEHLPHLGERFYRVDKARSREVGGAGLGLSIARGIARAHGGALRLASLPGQGTTATLAMPMVRAGAERRALEV